MTEPRITRRWIADDMIDKINARLDKLETMPSTEHEYQKALLLVRIDLLEQRCEKLEGGGQTATHTPQSVVDQLKQQLAEETSRSIKSQNERDEWKRKYEETELQRDVYYAQLRDVRGERDEWKRKYEEIIKQRDDIMRSLGVCWANTTSGGVSTKSLGNSK